MIKPPEIYGEWIPLLKQFAEGKNDREVLPAMQAGTIPRSGGPWNGSPPG